MLARGSYSNNGSCYCNPPFLPALSRIVLSDNHQLHVATEHLKCGWSQLRCAVTGKYTPLKGETTVSLQFTSDCDVTKK